MGRRLGEPERHSTGTSGALSAVTRRIASPVPGMPGEQLADESIDPERRLTWS